MTELRRRIERLGVQISDVARDAGLSRGALSNAVHNKRSLSLGAAGRVDAVLRRLESRDRQHRAELALGSVLHQLIGGFDGHAA